MKEYRFKVIIPSLDHFNNIEISYRVSPHMGISEKDQQKFVADAAAGLRERGWNAHAYVEETTVSSL